MSTEEGMYELAGAQGYARSRAPTVPGPAIERIQTLMCTVLRVRAPCALLSGSRLIFGQHRITHTSTREQRCCPGDDVSQGLMMGGVLRRLRGRDRSTRRRLSTLLTRRIKYDSQHPHARRLQIPRQAKRLITPRNNTTTQQDTDTTLVVAQHIHDVLLSQRVVGGVSWADTCSNNSASRGITFSSCVFIGASVRQKPNEVGIH